MKHKLFGHTIDVRSTLSVIEQVTDILRTEIKNGRWNTGDRLPTTAELSEATGIGATTISKALSALADEGQIDRQVGRGSFVLATDMLRKRTGMIAVVPGGSWSPGYSIDPSWPFVHFLIERIDFELAQCGYKSQLLHRHDFQDQTSNGREMQKFDGLINIGAISSEFVQQMQHLRMPLVCLGTTDTPPGVPYVAADDRNEMWMAVDRLMESRHRKIGLVSTFPGQMNRQVRLRRDAFLAACGHAGVNVREEWIVNFNYNATGQIALMRDYLAREDRPTAVVCAYMPAAKAVYEAADLLGMSIPRDLSVIGLSPLPEEGSEYHPPLTTLVANLAGQAAQAVRLIIEMVREGITPICEGNLVRSVWTPRSSISAPK